MKRLGQIWIETVLYTLIGLALIGISLAIVTPKINSARDRIVVEQTIDSLGILDSKINEVLERGAGNKRIVEQFSMKRGVMFINSTGDEIVFILEDLGGPYSEPGVVINEEGRIEILSETAKKGSRVYLTLRYKNINLTYGEDEFKKFSAAATPYRFSIENLGAETGNPVIKIEETSGR